MKPTKSAMTKLAQRVLAQASVGDLRVRIDASSEGNTRFAMGKPTTDGDVERLEIAVTATQGAKSATARGNATDDAALLALVQQAETMAALAPENPEHMPPVGAVAYDKVRALDPAAAKMNAQSRVAAVQAAIGAATTAGVEVAGFVQHQTRVQVAADRAGMMAGFESSLVSMSTTCRTADGGSARRTFVSHAAAGLDGAALAGQAAQWAKRSAAPTAMDPGTYTVVLAPAAVAELLGFVVDALASRAAMEGRSVFSAPDGATQLGESLFASTVDLWSDPAHSKYPASPMSPDGVPLSRTQWVQGGRLLALEADRYWADHAGLPVRPRPSSIHLSAGGSGDVDAMVAQVDRGVLVSRLWYCRMLEPRTLTVTGLTRDGTFAIENGALARPIKNFRFNESALSILSRLVAAGTPVRMPGDLVTVAPPVTVAGFRFESVSDAV